MIFGEDNLLLVINIFLPEVLKNYIYEIVDKVPTFKIDHILDTLVVDLPLEN